MTSRYVGRPIKDVYRGGAKPISIADKLPPGTDMKVYRGYMPENLPQHKPAQRIKWWWKVIGKPRVDLYPKPLIEGYSDQAEYPEILHDGSRKNVIVEKRHNFRNQVRDAPTIDEKLFKIHNEGQFKVANFNNWLPIYNSLPLAQFITHTHLVNSLPDTYKLPTKQAIDDTNNDSKLPNTANGNQQEQASLVGMQFDDQLISKSRDLILSQIAVEKYESAKRLPRFLSKSARSESKEQRIDNNLIQFMIGNLKRLLALETNPQLLDYQSDPSPSVRSWWFHSGFIPPDKKPFWIGKRDDDGHVNTMIQVNGSAALNLRGDAFLEPIVSQNDPLVTNTSLVEKFHHPLRDYGGVYTFKYPVTLPGYWYDSETRFEFPHTTFLSTNCLKLRNKSGKYTVIDINDDQQCLHGQTVLSCFSWLSGLATYHGFTPLQELEYPFTCQSITTDGQSWQFNIYQLNCHSFHRDLKDTIKNNICWSSGIMQLYSSYENGQFKEVNDDVIRLLVRFLSQKTNANYSSQLNLKPYVGESKQKEEDTADIRFKVRENFSQRVPRIKRHDWRVPLYEKIFFRKREIRNKITWMAARRRRFKKPPVSHVFD